MDDDWDLHAVVRGCTAFNTTTATATTTSAAATTTSSGHLPTVTFQSLPAAAAVNGFQDLFEPARGESSSADQELHELYKPFIFGSSESSQITVPPQNLPIHSPLSVLGGLQDLTPPEQLQIAKQPPAPPQLLRQKQQPFCFGNGSRNSVSHNPTPRPKKRKTQMKRVCHVAAENLSSDVWSWRKYGQKPIKGSPYPRGYYRCSTSKGCLARKQVERNRSDPGMFIVTYTAEHNHPMPTHRNSLAGSTRQKQPEVTACSPEMSMSPAAAPEKMESSREEEGEDDDGFSASKMDLEDDFFAGLEDFSATDSGDFAADVELPWLSTSVAGGG